MIKSYFMDRRDFYVYVYLDPRKPGRYNYSMVGFFFEPFYVGKGRGNRITDGLHRYRPCPKSSKLKAIKSSGLEAIPLIYSRSITERAAFDLECQLIADIGRNDLNTGPLANLTAGGDGTSGIVRSQEYRDAVSRSLTGRQQSPETKAKRAAKLKGHVTSEATRRKISDALMGHKSRTGWHHSDQSKAKMRRPKSAAAIINMRRARQGRPPVSEEVRAKISATLRGRPLSDETKQKMRGRTPWNKGTRNKNVRS